jgi:hypothetical protein
MRNPLDFVTVRVVVEYSFRADKVLDADRHVMPMAVQERIERGSARVVQVVELLQSARYHTVDHGGHNVVTEVVAREE